MPDDDAMRAAALIRDLVKSLDHNALLFCCISGELNNWTDNCTDHNSIVQRQ